MDSIKSELKSLSVRLTDQLFGGFGERHPILLTIDSSHYIIIVQHGDKSPKNTQIKRKQFNFWTKNWVLRRRSVQIGYGFGFQVITNWIGSLGISFDRWRWFRTTVESYKSIITIFFCICFKTRQKIYNFESIFLNFHWIVCVDCI